MNVWRKTQSGKELVLHHDVFQAQMPDYRRSVRFVPLNHHWFFYDGGAASPGSTAASNPDATTARPEEG